MCEQLAQGCHLKAQGRESNPRPSESQVQRPNHYATRPQDTEFVDKAYDNGGSELYIYTVAACGENNKTKTMRPPPTV